MASNNRKRPRPHLPRPPLLGVASLPPTRQVTIHSGTQGTKPPPKGLATDAGEPFRRPARPPAQFETNAHLNTGSSVRRNSINSISSGGSVGGSGSYGGGGSSWGLEGKTLSELTPGVWPVDRGLSPPPSLAPEGKTRGFGGRAFQGEDEEQEELDEDEEEASDGGEEVISGVQWGQYVEFVLPAEVKVRGSSVGGERDGGRG